MSLEQIMIGRKEYDLLKIYEKDAKALMKYLVIKHHDIYMKFMKMKMDNLERNLGDKRK